MSHRPPMRFPALIAVLAALVLGGCAAQPDPNSFGGRLALEGGEVAAIGKDWNEAQASIARGRSLIEDGEEQVSDGEDQIRDGEDDIEDGQSKIARGKRLIREGEARAAQAEQTYRTRFAAPSLSAPAN